jgi:hypothetical protein
MIRKTVRFRVSGWACCALLFMVCGPLPTDIGKNNYSVQLYLEDGTKTTATFSGEPIKATITLPDSFVFDDIAWHLGNGHYRHPGIAPGQKMKSFDVELFWTALPASRDSATRQLYDSVYVSLAGETIRSNRVRVNVTNVPPVFDSVRIGSSPGRTGDTIRYTIALNDTSASLAIRAGATDINRDTLRYDWYSANGVSLSPAPMVTYSVPKAQFSDTVIVTVYDGKGGHASTVICLSKLPPNVAPVIDSIGAGARTFPQDTTFHVVSLKVVDTLRLALYSHDADAGDVMTVTWTHKNSRDSLVRTPANSSQVFLVCDSIYKKVYDSLRTVDTVVAVVKDQRGDSAKTVIRIVQGSVNNAPKLDSIRVNAAMQCRGATLLARDTGSGRDTFMLRVFSTDIDSGDSVKLTIAGRVPSAVLKISDTAARYICKDSLYTDTLFFIVKDLKGDSARKSIVVTVNNRLPSVDSIRVIDTVIKRDTMFRTKDSLVMGSDSVAAKDSVKIRLYAHDPDPSPADSVSQVQWTLSSAKTMKLLDVKGLFVQYPCQDSTYNDTINVRISDLRQKTTQRSIVLKVKK